MFLTLPLTLARSTAPWVALPSVASREGSAAGAPDAEAPGDAGALPLAVGHDDGEGFVGGVAVAGDLAVSSVARVEPEVAAPEGERPGGVLAHEHFRDRDRIRRGRGRPIDGHDLRTARRRPAAAAHRIAA